MALFVSAIVVGLTSRPGTKKNIFYFVVRRHGHHTMERPAYKINDKARIEERIYIKKEALIYSDCSSKETHSQICDSICAVSDNEVYIINKSTVTRIQFTEDEVHYILGR